MRRLCLDFLYPTWHFITDPDCTEGEVRLFNNQSSDGVVMGQVELCRSSPQRESGFRTKVCDTDWDDHDAEVVCRQLGLPSGKNKTQSPKPFNGLIMDHVLIFCSQCYSSRQTCVWRRRSGNIL